jgi:hypothetical protein
MEMLDEAYPNANKANDDNDFDSDQEGIDGR